MLVEGINIVKKHQRPNPRRACRAASWRRKRRSTSPTSCCCNPATGRAIASASVAEGRPQGAFLQVQRRSAGRLKEADQMATTARLQKQYREDIVPKLRKQLGLKSNWKCRASPRSRSTWAWARPRPTRRSSRRGGRHDRDHRPEAGGDKAQMRSRPSRCARTGRSAAGHAAPRAHVRVPGPPDQHRAAAHPRLPRRVPRSFDGRGNYNLGIKEQIIFPEIDYDKIDASAAWTSRSPPPRRRQGAKALLEAFSFPFRK